MRRLFAGFDGGGTRTTCVVCDQRGNVLGVGTGGRANYHDFGISNALSSLRFSFKEALARSGISEDDVSLEACFGLAGLDSREDFASMGDAVRSMPLVSRSKCDGENDFLIENDWRTAVTGAFINDPGVTLIAGTGCVAAAQRGAAKVARVGGWGHIVDDRGSAYDIGREALYAAMRDFDGRGPRTKLLALLMSRLKVAEPQGIIARVYAEEMSVSEIASLSTLVGRAADEGDRVAQGILEAKGRILGELVVAAASRLDMLRTRFGVSFNGGVFKAGRPVIRPLEETVRKAAPRARLVEPRLPPACGAVILLLRRAKIPIDDAMVARMRNSLKRAESKGQSASAKQEARRPRPSPASAG